MTLVFSSLAMASHTFSLVLYDFAFMLLCSFVLIHCSYVAGDITGSQRTIINVSSLLPQTVCTSAKGTNMKSTGTRLKLIHQHGPCSPFNNSNEPTTHNQILTQDQSRVNFINQHPRRDAATTTATPNATTLPHQITTASKIPAHTGDLFMTGNYIVTIGFGTPERDLTVVFDTGSDVTWIQCQPCSACYSQKEPLFQPLQSSTYSTVSCSDPACSELYKPGCSGDTCVYQVVYKDNSYTVGFFSKDTLTLSPSDVLPGFLFGCGNNNMGLFGNVAGLLGLGRRPTSLISQSNTKYNGVFSYCLPSTSSSTGYLTFGEGAPANIKYTPMLTNPSMPSFYFLDLQSISVDGTQLSISPTVFSNVGTIIDSGTVISRLPPEAYSSLRDAFKQKMSNYPEVQGPGKLLDTCYDLSSYGTMEIPKVSLEFADGLVLDLGASQILYLVNDLSQACLGFAGTDQAGDVGVLGNTQQRTLSVVYDVPNQVIGFAAGECD